MRVAVLMLLLACGVSGLVNAQSGMAVPISVRDLIRADLPTGRLVRVSGYLETTGQTTLLRDLSTGQKISLDFAVSAIPRDRLVRANGNSPVEITGRTKAPPEQGRAELVVLGGIALTL
jgi:hypothetical protein